LFSNRGCITGLHKANDILEKYELRGHAERVNAQQMNEHTGNNRIRVSENGKQKGDTANKPFASWKLWK
jgi:hypothetical protein